MKLTKKIEAEIKFVMNDYWESYLKGNLEHWANYLVNDYRNIGSTEVEIWNSKKEIYEYSASVVDQMVGFTELRNKQTEIIPYDPYVMVHEYLDIYIKVDEKWTFYSKLRLSSLIQKIDKTWKILHQHGSYPDSKVMDGEFFAFDTLKSENLKLQKAIKNRTLELEAKNHDLEIEAALERVRTVAMGMNKSEDLLKICEVSFKEFQNLGFENLRNAVIHVLNDEQKYFMDYDFSDFTGGQIGKVGYGLHPIVDEYLKKIRSAKDAFFEVVITEDMLEDWNEFRRNSGQMHDQRLDNAKALYYYLFSIGIGDIGISAFKPIDDAQKIILKKFRNVFDLAYRRYSDITLAEAQAREAQIEAALERVRAKAMAMNSTEDLTQTADTFFFELVKLNITPHRCGIGIVDKETRITDIHATTATENKSLKIVTGKLKLDDHPILEKIFQGFEKQEEYHPVLRGKEISDYYEVMNPQVEFPDFSDDEVQYGYYFYFKEGGVFAWNDEEFTANELEIFRRYTSVLSLTYRRYIDLKEAEAQAREAQIEAALERVRAKSMAMHKSDELADLSFELVKQVQALGISTWFCAFNIYDDDPKGSLEWGSNAQGTYEEYRTPREGIFLRYYEAGQRGETLLVNEIGEDECPRHYEYLCSLPGVGEQLLQMKEAGIPFPTSQIDHVAFFKYGYIIFITFEPALEAHNIFIRFAKVFEQTYTRFLDLQKAEAQAREAQIEAALERVRASSMAMHKSEDLSNVASVTFEQMKNLGGDLFAFGIVLCDKHKKMVEQWHSLGNEGMMPPFFVPIDLDYIHQYRYDQWKAGVELFSIEIPEDYIARHFELMFQLPSVEAAMNEVSSKDIKVEVPKWEIDYGASFKHGYLLVSSLKPFKEDHIFPRFAKVFEQAYTRFLDLKKAEAQAREAKIETALEKVRARTMGMQHSDELPEAANLLFLEVQALGIPAWSAGYNVLAEDKKSSDCWMSSEGAIQEPAILYFTEEPSFIKWYDFLQSEETFFVQELGGEALVDHYSYLRSIPDIGEVLKKLDDAGIELPTYQINHLCKYTHGFLLFITYEPVPESHDIFRRFAKVFEQTYTRFLDLKKAEAQTREAKIEATLERVRSRSMGMAKSEELKDVIKTIFDQLTLLDINAEHAGIVVDYKPKEDWTFWVAESQDIPSQIKVPYLDSEWDRKFTEAKASGEEFFTVQLNFEEKNSFYDELLSHIPDLTKKARDFYFSCQGLAISTVIQKDVGLYVENFSGVPYSDEENEIVIRFGKVFQQTYTRFLDLKKAEAQAREAKVEAALERVRSLALGMRKSEEVGNVTDRLFTELTDLSVDVTGCSVVVIEQGSDVMELWRARSDVAIKPFERTSLAKAMRILEKYMPDFFPKFFNALSKRTNYLIDELSGKRRLQFINAIGEQYNYSDEEKSKLIKNAPENITTHYIFFKLGYLALLSENKLSHENLSIARRFIEVFDFAYTRFLDIQKAEEQAREAQIEASLEKVRGVALSLKKSDEMLNIAQVLYKQLLELGFKNIRNAIIDIKNGDDDTFTDYDYSHEMSGTITQMSYQDDPTLEGQFKKMATTTNDFFELVLEGKELDDLKAMRIKNGEDEDPRLNNIDVLTYNLYSFGNGAIGISNFGVLSKDEKSILNRFSNVFTFAYKRYNDLVQSELQARETQIELSLERIRAQVTSMKESEEILEIVVKMRAEFVSLGYDAHYFWYMKWTPDKYLKAMTSGDGTRIGMVMELPRKIHGEIKNLAEWEKSSEPVVVHVMDVEATLDYVHKMAEWGDFKQIDPNMPTEEDIRKIGGLTYVMARTMHGEIGYSLPGMVPNPPDDALSTIVRFAGVFDLAYRRFEDLKRSEEQFRESQIELGLERVRAKAMAMHKSDDLTEAVTTVFAELGNLGFKTVRCGIGIFNDHSKKVNVWTVSSDGNNNTAHLSGDEILEGHPLLEGIFEYWQKQKDYSYKLEGKDLNDYYEVTANSNLPVTAPKEKNDTTIQYYHCVMFPAGGLFAFSSNEFSNEAVKLMKRFADVFNLTFTRHLDLKHAELRARAAEQQASIDRVRGEIASMRTTKDLEKITPLIWRELTNLNIKFFRCGIFIINEPSQVVKVYLTTPTGKSLAALHLPFKSSQLVAQSVKFWKKNKVYKEQWNREQFIAWAKSLIEQGHIKNTSEYQGGEKPPETLSLQFLPFTQGMLYVGSAVKLTEEEIETAQKLADSFGVAYARYEDFQKLEAANHRKSLELEEARQLQLAMLPKVLPQLPNLDIAVYMQTATEVGGDYYDFNVGEDGQLTAVIGDATGHGMKAGTIVTITKSLFNSLAHDDNILNTFSRISKVIRDMKFKQLSMCLMMLKIHEKKIIISSAAMPPALIYRKKKNIVEEIELKGMPLGAMDNFPYQVKDASVDSGDTILLMSDGLPELPNGNSEMYGYDKIMDEFKLVGKKTPEKIIEHLKKSAAKWINGNDPDDDITFVVIKVK